MHLTGGKRVIFNHFRLEEHFEDIQQVRSMMADDDDILYFFEKRRRAEIIEMRKKKSRGGLKKGMGDASTRGSSGKVRRSKKMRNLRSGGSKKKILKNTSSSRRFSKADPFSAARQSRSRSRSKVRNHENMVDEVLSIAELSEYDGRAPVDYQNYDETKSVVSKADTIKVEELLDGPGFSFNPETLTAGTAVKTRRRKDSRNWQRSRSRDRVNVPNRFNSSKKGPGRKKNRRSSSVASRKRSNSMARQEDPTMDISISLDELRTNHSKQVKVGVVNVGYRQLKPVKFKDLEVDSQSQE